MHLRAAIARDLGPMNAYPLINLPSMQMIVVMTLHESLDLLEIIVKSAEQYLSK